VLILGNCSLGGCELRRISCLVRTMDFAAVYFAAVIALQL
jgi:hypothetical protein